MHVLISQVLHMTEDLYLFLLKHRFTALFFKELISFFLTRSFTSAELNLSIVPKFLLPLPASLGSLYQGCLVSWAMPMQSLLQKTLCLLFPLLLQRWLRKEFFSFHSSLSSSVLLLGRVP